MLGKCLSKCRIKLRLYTWRILKQKISPPRRSGKLLFRDPEQIEQRLSPKPKPNLEHNADSTIVMLPPVIGAAGEVLPRQKPAPEIREGFPAI
jgi:hypothetical protein